MNETLLSTQFPNQQRFFEQMSKEEKEEYLQLYEKYYQLFLKYLLEKIPLKDYDELLKESELDFKVVSKEEMDIYQYLSSSLFNYFYIHNNVYIERLTDLEKKTLQQITKQDEPLTEEARKFIEKTYKRCVLEGQNITEREYVNFGPQSPQFYQPSNSIIIGFRYDEYEQDVNQTDEEWDIRNQQREDFLLPFLEKIEKEFDQKLPVPIRIIWYDDESIYRDSESIKKKNFEDLQEKYIEQLRNSDPYKGIEEYLIASTFFPNGWYFSNNYDLKTKLLKEACEKKTNLKELEGVQALEEAVVIKKK